MALEVEKISRDYGYDFRWLRIQLLRASESVCANMTEGFYSQYSTEYLHSLFYCRREARSPR
ncbi:MAG: four helix bundle protein [Candidatus Marinimicrobia bacterium]|nr:four helix bundle protein [Candidatus Neomarinimicrobiota bacterium]